MLDLKIENGWSLTAAAAPAFSLPSWWKMSR